MKDVLGMSMRDMRKTIKEGKRVPALIALLREAADALRPLVDAGKAAADIRAKISRLASEAYKGASRKNRLSTAARKRIAAAQVKRWKAYRAAKTAKKASVRSRVSKQMAEAHKSGGKEAVGQ